MSEFTDAIEAEAKAMVADLYNHMQTRLFKDPLVDFHAVGRRWGKSRKARRRHWKSWVRRRLSAGLRLRLVLADPMPRVWGPGTVGWWMQEHNIKCIADLDAYEFPLLQQVKP